MEAVQSKSLVPGNKVIVEEPTRFFKGIMGEVVAYHPDPRFSTYVIIEVTNANELVASYIKSYGAEDATYLFREEHLRLLPPETDISSKYVQEPGC